MGYFVDLNKDLEPYNDVVYRFAKRYNCDLINLDGTHYRFMHCTEEDFVVIMLTCPEAVAEVLSGG